ncbi:DUF4177 domain-containing protein [Roseobacter weihaiensis]|uniref:DUF4177 domain-containing protein n=1 Tax=Roseobacter weihaiensis TaxID=2763262 RepID=UPI001D0A01D9|nr:DUF4177 domain-containing protein [Roseobacter sp. H9]
MSHFEYRVIAAPTRGVKAKGIKTAEARFLHALEEVMNTMASEGWEYQRAETLPSEERSGLLSTTSTLRNVLVFRRVKAARAETEPTLPPLKQPAGTRQLPPEPELTIPQNRHDDASGGAGEYRLRRDADLDH